MIPNSWYDPDKKEWVVRLNEYQRNNLLLLINAIGFPCADRRGKPVDRVEPFTLANTGDWLGELGWMLSRPGEDAIVGPGDRANTTLDELRTRIRAWKETP